MRGKNKKELLRLDREADLLRSSQEGKSNIEIQKELKEKRNTNFSQGAFQVSDFFGISGVYYLLRDNEVVYIGESICIFSRLSQHFKSTEKEFNTFKYEKFEGSDLERKRKEAKLIKKYRPVLNFTHNPNIKG
tara:strand:- start:1337 stop:1735 length:399 start_codon:yes stop_codon:yes gene_type:complete